MLRLSTLAFLAVVALPTVAQARTTESLPWSFSQVYRTTIRLVRVDLGCEITERDEDAGYLTFDYESSGRIHHGSIEVIPVEDDRGVRVIVQLTTLPSYVERMVLNRLERKLRDEIGEPRVAREPTPPAAPPAEPDEPAEAPDDDDEEPTHDASGDVPPGPYW